MIKKEYLEKSITYEGFLRKGESQYLAIATWDGNFFRDLRSIVRPGGVQLYTIAYYDPNEHTYFEPSHVFCGDPNNYSQ